MSMQLGSGVALKALGVLNAAGLPYREKSRVQVGYPALTANETIAQGDRVATNDLLE